MSEKRINLEEIFNEYRNGYLDGVKAITLGAFSEAMLDFGKQLLELAAENAKAENSGSTTDSSGRIISGKTYVIKETITDTIKQVE